MEGQKPQAREVVGDREERATLWGVCSQGSERPCAMGQKQEGAMVDCSDPGFRSHCICPGHFLLKYSLAFPLLSDLTSPRCNAELIGGGQRAEAAILSKGVCRGNSSWLTQAGWTAAGLDPCSLVKVWELQPRRLWGVGSEQWGEEAEGMTQVLFRGEGLCQISPFFQTQALSSRNCPDHPNSALIHVS